MLKIEVFNSGLAETINGLYPPDARHRMQTDGLLERNHLKGADGDAINAILVAAGHNLRLLLAWFAAFLRALFSAWLGSRTRSPRLITDVAQIPRPS